jgi:hypothetical protein
LETLNLDILTFEQNLLFNKKSEIVRNQFDDLTGRILNGHEGDIHWILSSIASRNYNLSPLFIRCSQLLLVDDLYSKGKVTKLISRDRPLLKCIKRHYLNKRQKIEIECSESLGQRIKKVLIPAYKYYSLVADVFRRFLARKPIKLKSINFQKPVTLLDMFVINSKVGEQGSIYEGKYIDRYYPGLFDYLSNEEKELIYYLPSTIGFKSYKQAFKLMRNSKDRIIVKDDFLKLPDYLKLIIHPLKKLLHSFPELRFQDFEISSLLRNENYEKAFDSGYIRAYINFLFAKRLARSKIQVRLLVEWFENQVIDRGMIKGFHSFLPNVHIVGYQGFIVSPHLHHYVFPIISEILGGAAPDELAVIGDGLMKQAKQYSSNIKVVSAPAFRNQNVWQSESQTETGNERSILVALPMYIEEAADIIKIVNEIEESVYSKIWIKPHPSYGPEKIQALVKQNRSVEIVTGYFNDFLEKAEVLISNASITVVEAIAKGKPVIVIGNKNGILQNPIPETISKDIWNICYQSEDTQDILIRYFDTYELNRSKFKEIGNKVRQDFFEKTNESTVRKFLHLN